MARFEGRLRSMDELREVIAPPEAPAVHKAIDRLDSHCRDFIARSPFLVLASCDSEGRCDASPRGGAPGFCKVLDDERLVVPDYPGSRRVDSFANILDNGGVELIFFIPALVETLRVRGRACISRDPGLLRLLDDRGRTPKLALGVEVERCFLQCGKSLKRSGLWQPETWPERDELPKPGRIFRDHIALPEITEEAANEHLAHDYAENLWPA